MAVLVTGAKGMLGQDLCPIFEDAGYEVIETDVDTLDITNAEQVKHVLEEYKPEIVIHCAAYTNVDKAEEDLKTAELINVTGTENIADACGKLGITLVYISTDYVFNGCNTVPYKPNDMPNPINNYGQTKYEGEEAVRSFCEKYYIARTSWLYGHHGKNFVETMISLKKPYGTYHVCGSGHTSWYGFAKEIFRLMDLKVNIQPCATDEFPRPAKRPAYSVMDNDKICRQWEAALKDYLDLRIEA